MILKNYKNPKYINYSFGTPDLFKLTHKTNTKIALALNPLFLNKKSYLLQLTQKEF